MRCALRWAGLAVMLALVLPLWAQNLGKGKVKIDPFDPTEKYEKSGKWTGTLASLDTSSKALKLEVKWTGRAQNAEVFKRLRELEDQFKNTIDANKKRSINAEYRKLQRDEYVYKEKKQSFDFQATDDVKVRWKNLPPVFDDKGNLKKPSQLTAKEREELKGPDKKLPGYQAEFADLRQGMTVELHVLKKDAKGGKAKDKDKDDDDPLDKKTQVSMIIITGVPPK